MIQDIPYIAATHFYYCQKILVLHLLYLLLWQTWIHHILIHM